MIETTASKSFADRSGDTPFASAGKDGLEATRVSPLLWLHLVCLDAPFVAIIWAFLFARHFDLPSACGAGSALFLTAWLIYLADRFGDSVALADLGSTSLRQRFCIRRRPLWLAWIGIIATADLLVIGTQVEARTLLAGGGVGLFALAYLTVNQWRPSCWRIVPLKEISIGFLFAAGTMVPLVAGLTSEMLPTWLLFAFLCSLNCVSIAVWERGLDVAQGRISVATAFPQVGPYLQVALVLLTVASGVLFFAANTGRGVLVGISVSAALLAGVHFFRDKVQADLRTALADLVLLTPVFALLL